VWQLEIDRCASNGRVARQRRHGVDLSRIKRIPHFSLAILAVWLAAATLFAWRRIPFYDEWLSISLARDATWPQFKEAVANAGHPPWLALADRALYAVCADRRILCVPRLVASLAGILVLRRVVLRQWPEVGPTVATLAAFHPVVFMYAGAVRWYPFALLADAVRAWALWGTSHRRSARWAFLGGAVLGFLSGFAEALLVAVDAAWLLRKTRDRRALATVAVAGAVALGTLFAAPFIPGWPRDVFPSGGGAILRSIVAEAALGPLGTVVVPWPTTPIVLLAVPGLVWGFARALTNTSTRPFAWWTVTVAVSWTALLTIRIPHPRYSLALWYLTTCTLGLLRGGRLAQLSQLATASYIALALWLTLRQHDFAYADENEMASSDCGLLVTNRSALVVTSYLRTAEELRRICGAPGVVSARNARVYGSDDIAPIRDALRAGAVTFVHVNAPGTMVDDASERLGHILSERCNLEEVRYVEPSSLAPLRRVFKGEAATFRYTSESWICRN
jgi:hypothetical protein